MAAKPNVPDFARNVCELFVLKLAKGVHRLPAEDAVAAEIGLAGLCQHLAQENRFELLRAFAQLFALGLRCGAAEPVPVAEG